MFRRKLLEKENEISRLQTELSESIKRQEYLKNILFNGINGYINAVYVEPEIYVAPDAPKILFQRTYEDIYVPEEIEAELKNLDSSFSDKLMELIREKKLNEVEVYKKADIDRRHFSKIRSTSSYRPKKDTVILLCLSMELTYEESQDLLTRAGLALSRSCKQDIIAEYFLRRGIYDVLLYKEVLYNHGFISED